MGIGGDGIRGRHSRCRNFLTHLTIFNANQLYLASKGFSPNRIVPIFRDRDYRAQWCVLGMFDLTKLAVAVNIQFAVNAHPQLAGMIFEQRCDSLARQTILRLNRREPALMKKLKCAVISYPDSPVSNSEN